MYSFVSLEKELLMKRKRKHPEYCAIPNCDNKYKAGSILQREIGEIYGISQVTVGQIINNKIWRQK